VPSGVSLGPVVEGERGLLKERTKRVRKIKTPEAKYLTPAGTLLQTDTKVC